MKWKKRDKAEMEAGYLNCFKCIIMLEHKATIIYSCCIGLKYKTLIKPLEQCILARVKREKKIYFFKVGLKMAGTTASSC